MDTLRSVSHLQREIGDKLFATLISSNNTEVVKQFAKMLAKNVLPTQMTVGERTYEILSFVKKDEVDIKGDAMVSRAKKMHADLDEEDGQYILDHQGDIPIVLCGKVWFVFPAWQEASTAHSNRTEIYIAAWDGESWVADIKRLDSDWSKHERMLRRKDV